MTKIADSWNFLFDFYKYDTSIVGLINHALGVKSVVTVRDESYETLLEDITSLLPNNIKDKSYENFLAYVTKEINVFISEDVVDKDDAEESEEAGDTSDEDNEAKSEDSETRERTEELENIFLKHVWINILANSSANSLFSRDIRQSSIPVEFIPYLILLSVDITRDWFLYGGDSAFCLVDRKKDLITLYNKLKKGFKTWQNPFHFYFNRKNIESKLFRSKQLSPEQLFPLMTLLIVLKREWEYSLSQKNGINPYVNFKFDSLIKSYPRNIVSHALICGLYNKYKDADKTILQQFHNDIPIVEIHPLIASHIIESKGFRVLFDTDNILTEDSITIYRKNKYINTEKKLGDDYPGKRLLIDYIFPQTEVRRNDVYVPSSSLTDKIYISLFYGKDYKDSWREPYDDELFDAIQIEPNTNLSGEDEDNRVIDYRDNLKPSGFFLVVKSSEDDIINNKIKNAFSDFRHDLKDLMSAVNIKHLQDRLIPVANCITIIQSSILDIDNLLKDPSTPIILNKAREAIKELDNDAELKYIIQDDKFEKAVYKIREAIEDFNMTKSTELLDSVSEDLRTLERLLIKVSIENLSKCSELTENIEESHNTLCSYIKIAGAPTIEKKDRIVISDYLEKYIRHATMDARRVPISLDCSEIDKGLTVLYNSAVLTVILNSIVDNAINHGFQRYECDSPQIKFIVKEDNNYLLLKICNNGRPIDITNEDYKTRGVFSGTTGHTGLGGYQISKYAEILGGYVELPQEKEWNTEIHLYIKK